MPCYMMYAFLFVPPQRNHFSVINKFYFCLGVGAEGLGVNAPKPRLLIICLVLELLKIALIECMLLHYDFQ